MRKSTNRGPGRPATHLIRPLIAIGAKVSIDKIDLTLDLACRAVNVVCDDPTTMAGLAALEKPICISTLRKRVAALMGGVKWRQLRSAEQRLCPHFAEPILRLVEVVVLSIHGHVAPPPPIEAPVSEDLDWSLEGLGHLELSSLSCPFLDGLEAVSTAESQGLGAGLGDLLGEWDDDLFKSIFDDDDFFTL